MSYSCEISFKTIEANKVYNFLLSVKRELLKNILDIAKDNYMYAPFVKYIRKPYSKLTSYTEINCNDSWVKQVFTYRYFYFPQFNLLGVYGVPKCVQSLFDATIYFQNSCDQDYEFETWTNIPLFKEIADRWQDCSDDYVISNTCAENNDNLDYYRRSSCYSEIWDLYISDTLYNEDCVIYFSCLGYYDLRYIQQFLCECEKLAIKAYFIKEE